MLSIPYGYAFFELIVTLLIFTISIAVISEQLCFSLGVINQASMAITAIYSHDV